MLRQTVQSVTISRIPAERNVIPEENFPCDVAYKMQIATSLDSLEKNSSSDDANDVNIKSNRGTIEENQETYGAQVQKREMSSEKKKMDQVEVVCATPIHGMKETTESNSSSTGKPLHHRISVSFQESVEVNFRSDSSQISSTDDGRKTVHCSALLLSAEKVVLPSNLLRAALLTRVLVCKDSKTESSGIESADDTVAVKSR